MPQDERCWRRSGRWVGANGTASAMLSQTLFKYAGPGRAAAAQRQCVVTGSRDERMCRLDNRLAPTGSNCRLNCC
jgi:hypothetical protein